MCVRMINSCSPDGANAADKLLCSSLSGGHPFFLPIPCDSVWAPVICGLPIYVRRKTHAEDLLPFAKKSVVTRVRRVPMELQ